MREERGCKFEAVFNIFIVFRMAGLPQQEYFRADAYWVRTHGDRNDFGNRKAL